MGVYQQQYQNLMRYRASAGMIAGDTAAWKLWKDWYRKTFKVEWDINGFSGISASERGTRFTYFLLGEGVLRNAAILRRAVMRTLETFGFPNVDFGGNSIMGVQQALVENLAAHRPGRKQTAVVGATGSMLASIAAKMMSGPLVVRMTAIACILMSRIGARVGEVAHTAVKGRRMVVDREGAEVEESYAEVDQHTIMGCHVLAEAAPGVTRAHGEGHPNGFGVGGFERCVPLVIMARNERLGPEDKLSFIVMIPTSKNRRQRNEVLELVKKPEPSRNQEQVLTNRLVDAMWGWAATSQRGETDPFFSKLEGGRSKVLTANMVTDMVKRAAREDGLDDSTFNTSSFKRSLVSAVLERGGSLADAAAGANHTTTRHTACYLPRGSVAATEDRTSSGCLDIGVSRRSVELHQIAVNLRGSGRRKVRELPVVKCRSLGADTSVAPEACSMAPVVGLDATLRPPTQVWVDEPGVPIVGGVPDADTCRCGVGPHGAMVQCTKQGCPYPWFHFGCVGLGDEAPQNRWWCPGCRM